MAFNSQQRILVVDDTPAIRKVIIMILRNRGCKNIIEAEDGLQAWEVLVEAHIKHEPIEFVLSDWNMPNLDGINLVKNMKADKRFNSIPILMISGEGEKENVNEAHKAGIVDFVVKPFDSKVLDSKLDEIFAA